MRFIDRFDVILLDMNGTFVFDFDRLRPDQDFFATYQPAGGRHLGRDDVHRIVNGAVDMLWQAYGKPERIDDFPSVAEALVEHGTGIEAGELSVLESVIALHELGSIPAAHEAFLRDVARTHRLGVVSNLWSRPDRWLSAFRDAGVLPLFQTLVFSSEGRSIKPSPALFHRALAAFSSEASVLFVGDSLERDVVPAKALGLATAWVAPSGSSDPSADVVVVSLPELARVAA